MLRKFTTQIAAILIVVFPSLALSEESISFDPRRWGLNPDSITAIEVKIDDQADDACWTNLRESREYAEEKLAIKGYNVVEKMKLRIPPNFVFSISVNAFRSTRGLCVGSIDVSVTSIAKVEEDGKRFVGQFTLLSNRSVAGAIENFNRAVVGEIGEIIDDM